MSTIDPNLGLTDAIAQVTTAINSYRDGISSDHFTAFGYPWNCDATSRLNIVGMVVMTIVGQGSLPAGTVFRNFNNQNIPITGPEMVGIAVEMLKFLSACYSASWVHKENILTMTDPIAIQEYDYMSTLWPDPNTQL